MTSELNQRLAEKAGGPAVHPEWYWFKGTGIDAIAIADAVPSADMPDFENSIDAQMHYLDPLVEKKWGRPFEERCAPSDHGFIWVLEPIPSQNWDANECEGTTKAAARAAAIDQVFRSGASW